MRRELIHVLVCGLFVLATAIAANGQQATPLAGAEDPGTRRSGRTRAK